MFDVTRYDPRSTGLANASLAVHGYLDAALQAKAQLLVWVRVERGCCALGEDRLDRRHAVAVRERLPFDARKRRVFGGHIFYVDYSHCIPSSFWQGDVRVTGKPGYTPFGQFEVIPSLVTLTMAKKRRLNDLQGRREMT